MNSRMLMLSQSPLGCPPPTFPTLNTAVSLNVKESATVAKEISEIEGACVDSGRKFDIIPNETEVEIELTMGQGLFLEGAVPGAVEVQCGACQFPTIDAHGNPIVLETKGCGIFYPDTTSKIVSLDNLLQVNCKVHFEWGQHGDSQYGCTITLPYLTVIVMIYTKGTWLLPMLTRRKAVDLHHDQYIATVNCMKEQVSDSNPYKVLLDLAAEAELQRESTVPADMSKVEDTPHRHLIIGNIFDRLEAE
eukprot:3374747-Rhodomonas_salina.1